MDSPDPRLAVLDARKPMGGVVFVCGTCGKVAPAMLNWSGVIFEPKGWLRNSWLTQIACSSECAEDMPDPPDPTLLPDCLRES